MKVGALSDTHLLQLVPLSKLIKNVTRATALDEIEIFEANMAELRANEFDELSSEEDESRGTPPGTPRNNVAV